jgi:hypothetical protein
VEAISGGDLKSNNYIEFGVESISFDSDSIETNMNIMMIFAIISIGNPNLFEIRKS